jgi:hypothetical protein
MTEKEPITTEKLINYIHELMESHKTSSKKGWSMEEDILPPIYKGWGRPAYDYAREYIIKNYGPQEE